MRLRSPERDERGAIAVMTAILLVVLLAVAAFAVDISSQVNARQKLHDSGRLRCSCRRLSPSQRWHARRRVGRGGLG